MIANNVLRINPAEGEVPTLYLAPFGRGELAGVSPIELELMTFLPVKVQEAYTGEPDHLLKLEAELEHTEAWGIYPGRISPDRFAGTVSLTGIVRGAKEVPAYIDLEKTVGTFIMDKTQIGKGLGTLAKVAVIAHALETGRARAFQAWVADDNVAAQRSLAKAGFVHRATYETGQFFPKGQDSQNWALGDPQAQPLLAAGEGLGFQALLQAGWRRFDAARQAIEVRVIDSA